LGYSKESSMQVVHAVPGSRRSDSHPEVVSSGKACGTEVRGVDLARPVPCLRTLADERKRRLEGRLVIHDETYNSAGQMRKGFKEVTDPRQAPGAHHPVFRSHPVTGKKGLYLGRRRNAYILGLPLEESERLLDELWAHASRPEFVWGHEWRVGDTLIWDNRCLIHRRDSFDPEARRMMHRVQIRGERPQ
jgi:taurine dioxygenase